MEHEMDESAEGKRECAIEEDMEFEADKDIELTET